MDDAVEGASDGPETEDSIGEAKLNGQYVLMNRPRLWAPLFRVEGKTRVIDLMIPAVPANLPAHRRILIVVFLIAVRDRASEIHFEPWRYEGEGVVPETGLRIFYVVDGKKGELAPLPPLCAIPLTKGIEAVAGLNTTRRRFAGLLRRLSNRIDGQGPGLGSSCVRLGQHWANVEAAAYPSELGERLYPRLPQPPESLAETAPECIEQLLKSWSIDSNVVSSAVNPPTDPR